MTRAAAPPRTSRCLRVFTNTDGAGGRSVEVVDGPPQRGVPVTASLTVHRHGRDVAVRDPLGRPTQAAAGALAVAATRPVGHELRLTVNGTPAAVWREGGLVWARIVPPAIRIVIEQQPRPATVARQQPVADPGTARFVWAFADAEQRVVRARFFPSTIRVEDDTNPDGALALQRRHPRPLLVRQGQTSVIFTRPAPGGMVEVGAYARVAN